MNIKPNVMMNFKAAIRRVRRVLNAQPERGNRNGLSAGSGRCRLPDDIRLDFHRICASVDTQKEMHGFFRKLEGIADGAR